MLSVCNHHACCCDSFSEETLRIPHPHGCGFRLTATRETIYARLQLPVSILIHITVTIWTILGHLLSFVLATKRRSSTSIRHGDVLCRKGCLELRTVAIEHDAQIIPACAIFSISVFCGHCPTAHFEHFACLEHECEIV